MDLSSFFFLFFFLDKLGSKRRSSDIISLLVSIYGSKDIFIDEYRAVLADRLLHQLNYNTARWVPAPSPTTCSVSRFVSDFFRFF